FSRGLPRPPAEIYMTANIKVAERKCYINGQFVGSGRQFAKINPVDGTVVAQVHEADRAMVDAAVRGARDALKGPWGRMALQARACGNTIVAKPSEETPSSATLLAEVMHEAGVPAGVYNVVHGFGPDSAGEFITTHPDVNGITFTGETATGAAIMKAVAPTVKPISFELGGKNPAIVFADCDFDAAAAGMSNAIFSNTGQVCL